MRPRLWRMIPESRIEELEFGGFQNGSLFRRRREARSASAPAGWSIAKAWTKKDALIAGLWLPPGSCALAQRDTSTISIGSALCMVRRMVAGGSYGWMKEAPAAI